MTIQHSYTYSATLDASLKVNWRVDDLIGDDKPLDFTKPFLPDALVHVNELDFLSEKERLVLNHIRGATYLHIPRDPHVRGRRGEAPAPIPALL
ncbi:MAG: hypothetical protein QM661_09490 [Solimonas sp.]